MIRLIHCTICLLIGLQVPELNAQSETPPEEIPPPWELTTREPGEPQWGPLLRLREAESQYRGTQWWSGYAQMRAHVEAGVGNHAAALEAWDSAYPPRDSVGVPPEGIEARSALEYLSAVADTARVIMINERHHAASDRLLTLELLSALREKGYRYFAAEAFDPNYQELNERAYPVEATGAYTKDPVFAAVVREAIRLGYTLVAYESMDEEGDDDLTPQQRRDFGQARNLARATVEADPDAKVLVHAGYSHVLETASERWYPMALYFREITGMDPITVDQTRLSERSDPAHEHPAYRAAIAEGLLSETAVVLTDSAGRPHSPANFAVDIQVLSPRTSYADGRPRWMSLGDRRQAVDVEVPEGEDGWCLVEARVTGEPPEAIPLDRAEVYEARRVQLFLPPETDVVIRILGADGTMLRTIAPPEPSPLKGEYFGEPRPGKQAAQITVPALASRPDHYIRAVTFSHDGTEAYWPVIDTQDDYTRWIVGARIENDSWTQPRIAPFSDKRYYDDVPCLSPDGNELFFLSGRPLEPEGAVDTVRIWRMIREGDSWSEPAPLPGTVNEGHYIHQQISLDREGTLYFAAEGEEGHGSLDVYSSRRINGEFQAPVNLGPEINGPAGEYAPSVSPDGSYLIFTRNLGERWTLFISFRTPDGAWMSPVSLKERFLEAEGMDLGNPLLTVDGKYLIFFGERDDTCIPYWVDTSFLEELRDAQ